MSDQDLTVERNLPNMSGLILKLTLTMPNFLNEIILPTFLALSIISFRDIKMKT